MDVNKLEKTKSKIQNEKELLINLLPKQFQDRFRNESFVGGGAIYSLYNNQEVKDYDFFLDNKKLSDDLRDYFNLYFDNKYTEPSKIKIGIYRGKRLVVTDNAISIDRYQIITRWCGSPKDVIEEFDFKHNQFYIYKGEIDTFSQWDFLEDSQLRFNEKRARDIGGCVIRVNKFLERGFKISNKEMAKMMLKLHEEGFSEADLYVLSMKNGDFES